MDKLQFGLGVCGIVAVMQGVSWICGHNGQVFALTSLIIGGVVGAIFGFKTGADTTLKKITTLTKPEKPTKPEK